MNSNSNSKEVTSTLNLMMQSHSNGVILKAHSMVISFDNILMLKSYYTIPREWYKHPKHPNFHDKKSRYRNKFFLWLSWFGISSTVIIMYFLKRRIIGRPQYSEEWCVLELYVFEYVDILWLHNFPYSLRNKVRIFRIFLGRNMLRISINQTNNLKPLIA